MIELIEILGKCAICEKDVLADMPRVSFRKALFHKKCADDFKTDTEPVEAAPA
jgi:hypothetical protein